MIGFGEAIAIVVTGAVLFAGPKKVTSRLRETAAFVREAARKAEKPVADSVADAARKAGKAEAAARQAKTGADATKRDMHSLSRRAAAPRRLVAAAPPAARYGRPVVSSFVAPAAPPRR